MLPLPVPVVVFVGDELILIDRSIDQVRECLTMETCVMLMVVQDVSFYTFVYTGGMIHDKRSSHDRRKGDCRFLFVLPKSVIAE